MLIIKVIDLDTVNFTMSLPKLGFLLSFFKLMLAIIDPLYNAFYNYSSMDGQDHLPCTTHSSAAHYPAGALTQGAFMRSWISYFGIFPTTASSPACIPVFFVEMFQQLFHQILQIVWICAVGPCCFHQRLIHDGGFSAGHCKTEETVAVWRAPPV